MVQARRVIASLFFGAKTISLVEPGRFTVLTSKPALQHTRLEQKHSCRRQKHRSLDCQHVCRRHQHICLRHQQTCLKR